MAEKKIYIGSVGPFLYDDTDPIDDEDGDFPGELKRAVTTNDQFRIGRAPVADEELVRKSDLEGTVSGSDTDFTVITAIQAGGAGGVGFQYKTRALTLDSGLVKTVGNESGWVDV